MLHEYVIVAHFWLCSSTFDIISAMVFVASLEISFCFLFLFGMSDVVPFHYLPKAPHLSRFSLVQYYQSIKQEASL